MSLRQAKPTFDIATLLDNDGKIQVAALVAALNIDRRTLATIAGLPRTTLTKTAGPRPQAVEERLREIVDILATVVPWSGSPQQALAWYRAQPLPGFGHLTAQDLVKNCRAAAVKTHLAAIAAGGYA